MSWKIQILSSSIHRKSYLPPRIPRGARREGAAQKGTKLNWDRVWIVSGQMDLRRIPMDTRWVGPRRRLKGHEGPQQCLTAATYPILVCTLLQRTFCMYSLLQCLITIPIYSTLLHYLVTVPCYSALLQSLVTVPCYSTLLQCLVTITCYSAFLHVCHVTVLCYSTLLQCTFCIYSLLQYFVKVPCYSSLLQYLVTVLCYSALLQYLVTIPCYNTLLQYLVTIPCYSTLLQYLVTIPCYNPLLQYLVTVPCYIAPFSRNSFLLGCLALPQEGRLVINMFDLP